MRQTSMCMPNCRLNEHLRPVDRCVWIINWKLRHKITIFEKCFRILWLIKVLTTPDVCILQPPDWMPCQKYFQVVTKKMSRSGTQWTQIVWVYSDYLSFFVCNGKHLADFYSDFTLCKDLLTGTSGPDKEICRDLDSSEMIWCKDQNNFCLWRESGIFAALVRSVETVFTEVHCGWIVLDIIVMVMLMIIYI